MSKFIAPALFISHGSPMRVTQNSEANRFLRQLPNQFEIPRGIVIISAHWETETLQISSQEYFSTIHDFWGFPDELHRITYGAQGPIWLQQLVSETVASGGFPVETNDRGLDHGAWSVLQLMYPQKDVPVGLLSLPRAYDLKQLYHLGESLQILREQGIMVIASGSTTHNLSMLALNGAPDDWAQQFVAWLQYKLIKKEIKNLFEYRRQAPSAVIAHPSDEHLRPLFIAMGAGANTSPQLIHDSWELKNMNNSSWAWL